MRAERREKVRRGRKETKKVGNKEEGSWKEWVKEKE